MSEQRWLPAVLARLDECAPAVVAQLAGLVRLPSISGSDEENTIQADLAEVLGGIGLEVDHWPLPLGRLTTEPDFPGMEVERRAGWGLVGLARGRGDGPSLLLNAHVDVVPPGDRSAWAGLDPFAGTVTADAVHGRGACDMKGGLVAALWAVKVLVETGVPLRGDLLIGCVQGEEDGGLGSYALLDRGWRADGCVIPEPTSLDVVPANGGSLTFRLRVPGSASHASRRTSGVSAVEKFWPVFGALRELEAERNAEVDPLMDRWPIAYPIEVGQVRAGDWSSTVPDLLVAEGRYGVALGETPAAARERFVAAVDACCRQDPWLRDHPVQVEWWGGQFSPGRTAADAAVVTGLRRAHAAVSGRPQRTWGAPYGSDLRLMNAAGVPTVHYGPGDAALAHSPREQVPVAEVLTTARTLAVLAVQHCGLA